MPERIWICIAVVIAYGLGRRTGCDAGRKIGHTEGWIESGKHMAECYARATVQRDEYERQVIDAKKREGGR